MREGPWVRPCRFLRTMIIRPRRLTPGYFRLLQVRGSRGWEGAEENPKILPTRLKGHRAVLGPVLARGEHRALPARPAGCGAQEDPTILTMRLAGLGAALGPILAPSRL